MERPHWLVAVALLLWAGLPGPAIASDTSRDAAALGLRPLFLVRDMDAGALKQSLLDCAKQPGQRTDFSIGHRGAALQFPEHTLESYLAAVESGAGIVECDVTFTSDKELVCRHAQCDLHATTNILATKLASQCSIPFKPAEIDHETGELRVEARARCCTSDITLAEFKTLRGKMDAVDSSATTVQEYIGGTPNWRTDLYASRGTLLSHRESIQLFKSLGVKMIPELKAASVKMPYKGFSQEDYAGKMIREYQDAGVHPDDVFPQSFSLEDILFWIEQTPRYGEQAVLLDGRYVDPDFDLRKPASWNPSMQALRAMGVKRIAAPLYFLVDLDSDKKIVPSSYARGAQEAGLGLVAWTLERSGPLADGGGWYYQSVADAIDNDGDVYKLLDVLAQDVGILGIFSDWPATVTYYANCKGL